MNEHIAEPRERRLAAVVWWAILMTGLPVAVGCRPSHYRHQADMEAYQLIDEKARDPRWALTDYQIDPNPTSRTFDPFFPDREPMPPDDPASHSLMHEVDGKKGFKHWDDNGCTTSVENPDWLGSLPLNEDGVLVLDAERSVQLARLHSRQYLRFLQHAPATQRMTLRKFRDQGFRAWLQRELRSRAVKRSAAAAGANRVGPFPSRRTSCLALPFDDAQAAEVARMETANARRVPER